MNKLWWLLVIFFVLYIIAIFKAPIIAKNIEKNLHIDGFNDFVINFKSTFDGIYTDLPSAQEFIEAYHWALSWAIKIKTDVINGAIYTKGKIDSVRETLSGAEDMYNKTVDFIDDASQKLEETQKVIDAVQNITSTWANN